jgi:hypothetical protein
MFKSCKCYKLYGSTNQLPVTSSLVLVAVELYRLQYIKINRHLINKQKIRYRFRNSKPQGDEIQGGCGVHFVAETCSYIYTFNQQLL